MDHVRSIRDGTLECWKNWKATIAGACDGIAKGIAEVAHAVSREDVKIPDPVEIMSPIPTGNLLDGQDVRSRFSPFTVWYSRLMFGAI